MAVDVSYEGVVLARGAEVRQTPGGIYVALELPMPVGTSLSLDEKGRSLVVKVARVHEGIGPGVIVSGAALPSPDVVVAPESVPQHSAGANGTAGVPVAAVAAPVAEGAPPPAPPIEMDMTPPPEPPPVKVVETEAAPPEMDMTPPSEPPPPSIEMVAPPEDDAPPPPAPIEAKKGDAAQPLVDDGKKTIQMQAFSMEELEKLNASLNKPSDTDPGRPPPGAEPAGGGPNDTEPGPNDTMARKSGGGGAGGKRKRKKTLPGT